MQYIDFASKISFYEFFQNEFKSPHFNTQHYQKEIRLLNANITVDYLTKIFETNPKIIDILEELLQLQRFTDAQYINFCFDVNVLNNADDAIIINYLKKSVFEFENGKSNEFFAKLYIGLSGRAACGNQEQIFFAKRAIIKYVQAILKKRAVFHNHIQNSIGTRLRVAKYLIENLNAAEYLSSVNLETFLMSKRHPIDTKGLHGKFGTIKIEKILRDNGFRDATLQVVDGFSCVREKTIGGILKRKDKKPKKFDFILLYNGIPRILIETNFYSTSGGGTKIGINQGEYVDLHEDIQSFNQEHKTALQFMWITDGNYWLSKDGENRFNNLKTSYFKKDWEIINYNLFRECLPKIKEMIANND
jgi:hypothetical protein